MHQRQAAKRKPQQPPAAVSAPAPDEFTPVQLGRASDEDLMRRTQLNNDRQAFSLLYERYSASVLSYLYRMLGNLEDVESIGQEVFLRAFRFAPTYRYPQKFSTWLFTITRNLAINQSRRRKRSPIRKPLPPSASSRLSVAPWAWATSRTIARPRPLPALVSSRRT